jgi:hypothetical protein
MKAETIEKIFNFLQEKEGMQVPEKWSLIQEFENHPDDIQYKHNGNLILSRTNIIKLPNDLYVDGRLTLVNCKQLTKLPDNLYVGRSLNLYGCEQLAKLPDNLYVGTNLSIDNTNIANIPNNLYVGGGIYIYDTPISKNYSDRQIRDIVTSTGGQIKGSIIRF